MALEVFANQPSTTVSSGGTDAPASGTVETWTVASSSEFPAASSSATPPTQFHVADALASASSELITVTNISGSTWTVSRGAEGTTPVTHVAGFTIYQVVTAGGMQQASRVDWLNVVTMFGADPTGTADSTAAIQAAADALPAEGGVVYLPAGTFKVESTVTVTQAGVYFQGDGRWATIINYTGSGDCIRMYSTTSYQPGDTAGGGLLGLTIDGTSASAGAAGFHIGDIYNLEFDCGVRSFQGTGSKGAWLDNNYYFAEQMHGRIWAEECTSHVVFDNSANTSSHATGSFDRLVLDIYLDAKGKGNGVTLQNGAFFLGSRLGIYGNTDYGSTTYYVLTITGSNVANGYSLIQDSTLNIDVECNATSGTQPATINFGTAGSNGIYRCTGNINFAGNNPFANANNWDGSFQYEGPVLGDTKLARSSGLGQQPYEQGAISSGQSVHTRYGSLVRATPSGAVTGLIMQIGSLSGVQVSQTLTVINDGTGTMTFAAPATSHVADGANDSIPAGTAATYVWDSDATNWSRVSPPPQVAYDLALAPSGATGETFPRTMAQAYFSSLTSSVVYMSAIPLPGNLTVNDITMQVGGAAFTLADVSHGWYALTDSSRIVRAVSADQTSGNWGSTFTAVTLPVTSGGTYTTTYAGLYYVALCITFTGSSGEFPGATASLGGVGAIAPVQAWHVILRPDHTAGTGRDIVVHHLCGR